jgi:hypothetical protein
MEEFEFLNNYINVINHKEKFTNLLKKWHLFREIKIVENYDYLYHKALTNNRMKRKLKQSIFRKSGKYNSIRIEALERLLYE